MTKCLIVDDHEVVTGGLSFYLSNALTNIDITRVGTVREAQAELKKQVFDLHFFDIALPDGTGLDLLQTVRNQSADAHVIIYTGSASALDIERLQDLNANAIISKAEPTELIQTALNAIEHGEQFISPQINRQISTQDAAISLTPRMRSVLTLLAEGHSNKEMAARLNMAEPTVSFHLRGLRERLGVNNNRETIKRARDLKLL